MLKVRIVAVGKDKDSWVTDGAAHFEKLLSRWCRIDWKHVPPPKGAASLSPDEIKRDEARHLQTTLSGFTTALTDSGKQVDSHEFAGLLERWQTESSGRLTFVIGGPYGLDESILQSCDVRLSLSPLTFSHQLVRLVLLEQLYRGFSILHNTDYHK